MAYDFAWYQLQALCTACVHTSRSISLMPIIVFKHLYELFWRNRSTRHKRHQHNGTEPDKRTKWLSSPSWASQASSLGVSSTDSRREILSGVTVWFQDRAGHRWYDLLTYTAAWKMPGTEGPSLALPGPSIWWTETDCSVCSTNRLSPRFLCVIPSFHKNIRCTF